MPYYEKLVQIYYLSDPEIEVIPGFLVKIWNEMQTKIIERYGSCENYAYKIRYIEDRDEEGYPTYMLRIMAFPMYSTAARRR
jgi:K+-transporting ATPase A subunit